MKQFYLVGEPIFKPDLERKEFYAPSGQADLCKKVVAEANGEGVVDKLREEYLAIVFSLRKMGVDFRIVYAYEELIDRKVFNACVAFGCRFVDFRQSLFTNAALSFPRDFCTVLTDDLILINSKVAILKSNHRNGCTLMLSPFGEGGRVLNSGKVIMIPERIIKEQGRSRAVEEDDIEEMMRRSIRIIRFPNPLGKIIGNSWENHFFFNDHLDRVSALIRDKNNRLHLIIDPMLWTTDWADKETVSWHPRGPEETAKKLKRICESLGIVFHQAKSIAVPYALNLIQFRDKRVLMTSGDDDAIEIVGDIVGKENLFLTPIPIRYYPTWLYAGIRCVVGESPTPLMIRKE